MRDRRRLIHGVILLVAALLLAAPRPASAVTPRLKALIVDGQSNHDWQQSTASLTATLLNTGRFSVDVSTSPPVGASPAEWAAWQPNLPAYDVVLSVYKGRMWSEAVRARLETYVSGGGGLVVMHAPLATFFTPNLLPGEPDWAAYSHMINLGWRPLTLGIRVTVDDLTGGLNFFLPPFGGSSNHGIQHSFVVKSRQPAHPIMDGLPMEWLHGKDELYHSMRGPAQNLNVLASAFSAPGTGGTGEHEPMIWETPYGLGRVVTTVMGHRWFGTGYGPPGTPSENGPDAVHCVGLQTLIARAAEWAAGGDVIVPVPTAFPSAVATSIQHPLRGVWLKLGLRVNGQHPASDVVVTPGPLRLTLDMAPALWAEPLDLYFAYVVAGQTVWVTSGGLSTTPAPLTNVTPLALDGLVLVDAALPPGAVISFVMFFAEGSSLVALDVVSAVGLP